MIKINSVLVSPECDTYEEKLKQIIKKTSLKESDIKEIKVLKRSIDARKKEDIKLNYSLLLSVSPETEKKLIKKGIKDVSLYEEIPYVLPFSKSKEKKRIVVCGLGPAGLFCAHSLAQRGVEVICVEQGGSMEERVKKVDKFFSSGEFDTKTNIQFGEGGAGSFSDGKLNTGINDLRLKYITDTFVKHGADRDISYNKKPHIGTDVLRRVIVNIRNEIISLGAKVYFNCKLTDIILKDGKVSEVAVIRDNKEERISCDGVVMAIGHSARDTFFMLKDKGAAMSPKAFSIGVRAEHPQEFINKAQYGNFYNEKSLGAAEYKLWAHLKNGRGVYSFCMCPGGVVVASSSEEGGVVTNGMSYRARDGKNANAALLCDVRPEDFKTDDVLGGVYFQREWERKAFELGGGDYKAPCARMEDFLKGRETKEFGKVCPTYLPGVRGADLRECLPEFVYESLREGIFEFNKKIKGYNMADAVLTGVETRSSSPVRILRGETLESITIKGLYPCGEGAGYAGGIMSAAADGIKIAEAIIGS